MVMVDDLAAGRHCLFWVYWSWYRALTIVTHLKIFKHLLIIIMSWLNILAMAIMIFHNPGVNADTLDTVDAPATSQGVCLLISWFSLISSSW